MNYYCEFFFWELCLLSVIVNKEFIFWEPFSPGVVVNWEFSFYALHETDQVDSRF